MFDPKSNSGLIKGTLGGSLKLITDCQILARQAPYAIFNVLTSAGETFIDKYRFGFIETTRVLLQRPLGYRVRHSGLHHWLCTREPRRVES